MYRSLMTLTLLLALCLANHAEAQTASESPDAETAFLSGHIPERQRSALSRGERIPVIVELESSSIEPIPTRIDPYDMELRARSITRTTDRVLEEVFGASRQAMMLQSENALSDERQPLAVRRTFSIAGGFSAVADAEGLRALQAHPDVSAIFVDQLSRPYLDETTSLVGADQIWSVGVDGSGTAVAILDTGVDKDHPMVGPAITASACFSSTVSGLSETLCPNGADEMVDLTGAEAGDACLDTRVDPVNGTEGCTHGTHVGSIAAGRRVATGAGEELSGVARGADIVAVNVFHRRAPEDCDGETHCTRAFDSDIIAALEWVNTHKETLNISTVNMSLGGGRYTSACISEPIETPIDMLRDAGIATIVASGNDRHIDSIAWPACVPKAVAVGATGNSDVVAPFSNSSEELELLAPGVDVFAALLSEEPPEGESCVINDADPGDDGFCHWLGRKPGTSMAAPHVAGAFALLRSAFPSASVDEIVNALKFTGVQVTDVNGITRSRIQVDAAYDLLSAGGAVVAGVELNPVLPFRTRGQAGYPASFDPVDYTLTNSGSSARTVSVIGQPEWLSVSPQTLDLGSGASGTLTFSAAMDGLPQSTGVGAVVLASGTETISVPVSIAVTRPTATAELGPFEWVGDSSSYIASVFRITGLSVEAPTTLDVAIDNASSGNFANQFSDCSLQLRDHRYNGSEYIVSSSDLADCGAFGRADVRFRIEAASADVDAGLTMRRFTINADGGITDYGFDGDGRSVATSSLLRMQGLPEAQAPAGLQRVASDQELQSGSVFATADPGSASPASSDNNEVFGPFEWVGDATASTGNWFRIAGLYAGAPSAINVALRNASVGGYADAFEDCSLAIHADQYQGAEYLIGPEDLASCGGFGRADLRFEVTADPADVTAGLQMRRFGLAANGGMTDFAFDQNPSAPQALAAIDGTFGQTVLGPFEWTGDADAPTQNVFRIVGFNAVGPVRVDVSVGNAANPGYTGEFSDCSLSIRQGRLSGGEYLITGSDLADCGDFGRGDLRFRVRGELSDVPEGLRIRRFAVGAHGDLTNFSFDHQALENGRSVSLPADAPAGTAAVEFGPFDWVGDAERTTLSVFRIIGLQRGAPASIDVALVNATSEGFTGSYGDCRIDIRPFRITNRGYVLSSNDLADCGTFGRADILFRVVADEADVSSGLTMRRFAVTSGGGLTDFGFD